LINRAILGLAFALASCTHPIPPPPPSPPKFTVGNAYQAGGEWRYPQIFDNYSVTGLSTVIPDGHAPHNADNEAYDPNAIAAASPVLQLPAIVTVTNLVNGYTMDVLVNDRGPAEPGRVLAVTPRVAKLLAFPADGVVEVQVVLKQQETAALDTNLGQGPKLTAAPVAGITAQALGAPGGGGVGAVQDLTPAAASGTPAGPAPLPATVTAVPPEPGPLYVQIPGFGHVRDAQRVAQEQLYGFPYVIAPVFGGDRTLYAINCGPYTSVADADAALKQILARGVTDPEIIVR
jgi:rare lipoprotein A